MNKLIVLLFLLAMSAACAQDDPVEAADVDVDQPDMTEVDIPPDIERVPCHKRTPDECSGEGPECFLYGMFPWREAGRCIDYQAPVFFCVPESSIGGNAGVSAIDDAGNCYVAETVVATPPVGWTIYDTRFVCPCERDSAGLPTDKGKGCGTTSRQPCSE